MIRKIHFFNSIHNKNNIHFFDWNTNNLIKTKPIFHWIMDEDYVNAQTNQPTNPPNRPPQRSSSAYDRLLILYFNTVLYSLQCHRDPQTLEAWKITHKKKYSNIVVSRTDRRQIFLFFYKTKLTSKRAKCFFLFLQNQSKQPTD